LWSAAVLRRFSRATLNTRRLFFAESRIDFPAV
jgi:hypothetical protein